jgi:cupin superfamily protein
LTRLIELDPHRFAEVFGRTSMGVRHHLVDHPLLELEALAQLADRLPAENVEHNVGALPTVVRSDEVARVDAAPGEIIRTIEQNKSWMVLKNVEADPAYRALLDQCLDEVQSLVGDRDGGMKQREAFIFLSAPDSVTPSHVDPEHNFLLQVRGTKQMHVGRFSDPRIEQRELERIYFGGHRNIEQVPDDVERYDLGPGDGVYVRPDAPHYVINGPGTSVSFSITWRTPMTRRAARVHRANGHLRRLRLDPKAPGGDPVRDRAKEAMAVGAGVAVRSARTVQEKLAERSRNGR